MRLSAHSKTISYLPMKVRRARYASTINLACVTAAAFFILIQHQIEKYYIVNVLAGLFLFIAAVALAALLSTGVYRIAAGQYNLDDIEQIERQKAQALSYQILGGGILMLGCVFLLTGASWSFPEESSTRQFLFWIMFHLILVLPAAILAWRMPLVEISDE